MAQPATRPERLRRLADELITLADADEQPSRSTARSDMLIAKGERIAVAVYRQFRGGISRVAS